MPRLRVVDALAAFARERRLAASVDDQLSSFYRSLFLPEAGHYRAFLELAAKFSLPAELNSRWQEMLAMEERIIAQRQPGPRIHSGLPC
jgi:tRNA isopentenyl-2-thiomethyl-A-37 hydroxylase MiaE